MPVVISKRKDGSLKARHVKNLRWVLERKASVKEVYWVWWDDGMGCRDEGYILPYDGWMVAVVDDGAVYMTQWADFSVFKPRAMKWFGGFSIALKGWRLHNDGRKLQVR